MLQIKSDIEPKHLLGVIERVFELSSQKISSLHKSWKPENGAPVFTVDGKYISRSWTEWTQGFQFGSALLQFDATGEKEFIEMGRQDTIQFMPKHISNIGVHDHGFNIISTFGNLHRLMCEGKIAANEWEKNYYELALKLSGAVQAARWTDLKNGEGYIYSFNGPHSLFADTIRSLRSLAVAYQLRHVLMEEQDKKVCLLNRLIKHAETTARYNVYFGNGRDMYDVRGRVAHESIFNIKSGEYRYPSTQQGYSPFTTWMRGLAWILCGFAEQLEFLSTLNESEFDNFVGKTKVLNLFEDVCRAVADFYIENTPTDGIPYWDSGAPELQKMDDYLNKASDPFNEYEPIDSSAAVIATQGLIRLGNYLRQKNLKEEGDKYYLAGLTIAHNIFSEPYLSLDPKHQGLILHSVYHRPAGWDYIPPNRNIPCGESSMWGDYHARELALMIYRIATDQPYYRFYL